MASICIMIVMTMVVVGGAMPRAPGQPGPSGTTERVLAPAIGGGATEAAFVAQVLGEPIDQVVLLAPDEMQMHELASAAAALDSYDPDASEAGDPPDGPPGQNVGIIAPEPKPPKSSSSSSSSSGTSPRAGAPPSAEPQPEPDEVDPVPIEDRVDGTTRAAGPLDQRNVYLWTFSHTSLPNRKSPADFTRQGFARAVLDAYARAGKQVAQWSCFQEVHPLSRSEKEQRKHFHCLVQADRPCRWKEIAQVLRSEYNVYASASTSSSRQSYWFAFTYLFCPSSKKPKEDIDLDYLLSPGHEDPPDRMVQRRQGIRRLQPLEVYKTLLQHGLDTSLKVYAFAARQFAAGDVSWVQYVMKQPPRKLKETITTAFSMATASTTLRLQALTHMGFLREALGTACICGGRAIPGWRIILQTNAIDEVRYLESLRALFEEGGGKGLNHFYIGDPSTGKTALTRPLLALFGKLAFVKPQVHTTFALHGLIGAKAIIWNDFRWPHPPLAWGDMLNVLDNEAFNVGVPKVDGQEDSPTGV